MSTPQPEETLAKILKVPASSLGNLCLTIEAISTCWDYQGPNPEFVPGRIHYWLKFDFMTSDRELWNSLENRFLQGERFGSVHLASLETNYPGGGVRLAKIQSFLLQGPETKNLIHSFVS